MGRSPKYDRPRVCRCRHYRFKPYVARRLYQSHVDYCKTCVYAQKLANTPARLTCYIGIFFRGTRKLAQNPRMAQMYRTWARMDEPRKETVLSDAAGF